MPSLYFSRGGPFAGSFLLGGDQPRPYIKQDWIPAFAGMTIMFLYVRGVSGPPSFFDGD